MTRDKQKSVLKSPPEPAKLASGYLPYANSHSLFKWLLTSKSCQMAAHSSSPAVNLL